MHNLFLLIVTMGMFTLSFVSISISRKLLPARIPNI
jgi:hypothetical protein